MQRPGLLKQCFRRLLSNQVGGQTTGPAEKPFYGGLRGFLERLRRGRIFRADLEPENWREPWRESRFRYPSPGSQKPALIPQGPQQRVFDITYHSRDERRRVIRETYLLRVAPSEPTPSSSEASNTSSLPPTPGVFLRWQNLGSLKEFTRE
ncbi:hypothetical protein CCYA_CCYA14G3855 [Cyanidiococcus yangmingshanensis]|nr:hypothetical protein CCYA_CCYA14G3855 [Cyanidiococcus yangmingshanensis]